MSRYFVMLMVLLLIAACNQKNEDASLIAIPTGDGSGVVNDELSVVLVDISGTHMVGKTQQEIDAAYAQCQEIMTRTNQPVSTCEPADRVFGDNPQHEVVFPEGTVLRVDVYEAHNSNLFPILTTQEEASRICEERGMRLPTGDEWELLATNLGSTQWPWGDTSPTISIVNIDVEGGNGGNPTKPVGFYEEGKTQSGLYDMVGNVAEWVSDQQPAVRGGSSGSIPPFADPSFKGRREQAGFRCVQNVTD